MKTPHGLESYSGTEAIYFEDLAEKGVVTAEELKTALQQYAQDPSNISGRLVIDIIDRNNFSETDLDEITALAQLGFDNHAKHERAPGGLEMLQREWKIVVDHIWLKRNGVKPVNK